MKSSISQLSKNILTFAILKELRSKQNMATHSCQDCGRGRDLDGIGLAGVEHQTRPSRPNQRNSKIRTGHCYDYETPRNNKQETKS